MNAIKEVLSNLFSDLFSDVFSLVVVNILWLVCSLPVITAIPAFIALAYSTNQLAHGKEATWRTFFEGFRIYLWKSWLWGLPTMIVILLIIINIVFYSNVQENWAGTVQIAFILMLIMWLAVQIYTVPLLLEQDEFKFFLALRNTLIMWLRQPIHCLAITLLVLVLAYFSTTFVPSPWFLISTALIMWVANKSTVYLLERLLPS